jgi:sulfite exporter TauE/SafE
MNAEILILCGTAASVGFIHTVLGPDHYLPFIAMSKAGRWSPAKTAAVTALCGVGHVMGSVVLGLIGVGFGVAVSRVEAFEGFRGNVAAWLLTGFGLAYLVWGLHRAYRNRPHAHVHVHADRTVHRHRHTHSGEHAHVHAAEGRRATPWILFTIFVFGPCEPLIPLLMYPAARSSHLGMVLVALVFSAVTIATMLGAVLLAGWGIRPLALGRLERYAHALAGATVLLCGVAIHLGL